MKQRNHKLKSNLKHPAMTAMKNLAVCPASRPHQRMQEADTGTICRDPRALPHSNLGSGTHAMRMRSALCQGAAEWGGFSTLDGVGHGTSTRA
mmetsp:Transcript_101547/g.295979  ORF Transcript_101547/g.295979 Transcript_101547/m.295979 type:complete len:93 (-) Transcript_101547:1391-1669(-)